MVTFLRLTLFVGLGLGGFGCGNGGLGEFGCGNGSCGGGFSNNVGFSVGCELLGGKIGVTGGTIGGAWFSEREERDLLTEERFS